jgi:hypothetical protein
MIRLNVQPPRGAVAAVTVTSSMRCTALQSDLKKYYIT